MITLRSLMIFLNLWTALPFSFKDFMPEARRISLELKTLRARAGRTRSKMADDLGLSVMLLVKLEGGQGNPRLSTIFQLCLVLARYLGASPRVVFNELVPEELYDEFTEISVQAADKLDTTENHPNSFSAKQKFLKRGEAQIKSQTFLKHVSYDGFQELYARSRFSQAGLARLTGVSERRLNQIFSISASRAGNMSLWVFLRLAAALSPVHGASIKETAFYLIKRELDELTQLYEREQQSCK